MEAAATAGRPIRLLSLIDGRISIAASEDLITTAQVVRSVDRRGPGAPHRCHDPAPAHVTTNRFADRYMIRNVVVGRLRPDVPRAVVEQALAAIVALELEGCWEMRVGVDAGLRPGYWGFSITADVVDEQAYRRQRSRRRAAGYAKSCLCPFVGTSRESSSSGVTTAPVQSAPSEHASGRAVDAGDA